MNIFLALLVAVCSWIVFSSINKLSDANGSGCCSDSSCGSSFFDGGVWWCNLFVALVFTLYVVYVVNSVYNPFMGGQLPVRFVRQAFGEL